MSRFHEIVDERKRLADELRQMEGIAKDVYGEPHALRWDKWSEGNPPDIWWDGYIHTEHGTLTRRDIIEYLSEKSNTAMDMYVFKTDTELRVKYENSIESFLEDPRHVPQTKQEMQASARRFAEKNREILEALGDD